MNQTKNISREESIDIIHDNILFTAFKRQLVDVSNLIGGTNQQKISDLFTISFEYLLARIATYEDVKDQREKQMHNLLRGIFERQIHLFSFSQLINTDHLILSENIYNEWQIALITFRNKNKAA